MVEDKDKDSEQVPDADADPGQSAAKEEPKTAESKPEPAPALDAPPDPPAEGAVDRVMAWRARRKLVREGKFLVKEVHRILRSRKRRSRVGREVADEVEIAAERLTAAMKARPWSSEGVAQRMGRVEELLDEHLSFARKSTLREYAEAIGMAAAVAILLRFFVIQPFKIPSGSMIPTLQVGDHIFVNKFSYGLRVPFTKDPPRHFVSWGHPHRGEVVVFIHEQKPDQDFIKRVVAIGGDRIKVINEQIYLQRGGKGPWKKVPRKYLPGTCTHMDKNERDNTWYRVENCTRFEESLDGHHYTTVYVPTHFGPMRDYPPLSEFRRTQIPVGFGFQRADQLVDAFRVPDDHIFVMGDNRRNSTDSRDLGEVGFIHREYIKGRALVVWWSWGPSTFRWSRVGTLIR